MKNKITIYLIRHGETYLNKYKKMQGWSDAPLTIKGISDAVETGQRLKDIKFNAIYSSDLGRTQKTAQLIREQSVYNKEIPIISKQELRESFFGSLDGSFSNYVYGKIANKLNIEVNDIFKSLSLDEIADAIKAVDETHDAETQEEVRIRVNQGINDIINETKGDNTKIMVVTHGNIIRTLVNMIDSTISVKQELRNAGITIIEIQNNKRTVVGFNE